MPHKQGEMGGMGESLRRSREEDGSESLEAAPERAEHTPESGPIRDIVNEIDHAPERGIVFLRGITAKHDALEARAPNESRKEAKGYVGALKKAYEGRDDVVVIGAEELGEVGNRSQYAESVIKKIVSDPAHSDKKIVLDLEPELEDVLFNPWKDLGDAMHAVMGKSGGESEAWLTTWMAAQDTEEEGEANEGPMVSGVTEAFESTLASLKEFRNSHLSGRPFSMGFDADNPMALAFLVYCAQGRLDPAALKATLPSTRREKKRIGFAHFDGENVKVSIGHERPIERRLG